MLSSVPISTLLFFIHPFLFRTDGPIYEVPEPCFAGERLLDRERERKRKKKKSKKVQERRRRGT